MKSLQMLTLSTERFQNIQKEAPVECQNYLVQVTKYQAAQNCKVTILVILSWNLWSIFLWNWDPFLNVSMILLVWPK